jgi:crotonobetainyl-CoA:carnitine CoA-transferase CaiB-like acyl-CoA transferase
MQTRTPFIAQNSGKERICIDLKAEEGKEIFRKLISRARAGLWQ